MAYTVSMTHYNLRLAANTEKLREMDRIQTIPV